MKRKRRFRSSPSFTPGVTRQAFFHSLICNNHIAEGFRLDHTSSMYRWRGSFFFCSCLAFHARIFRNPGMSMRSISSMRQPDSRSEL